MGQPVAEMIGQAGRKDLGFVLQPAEGLGVHYPVAVALEFVPVWVRQFRVTAPARALDWESQTRQRSLQDDPLSWTQDSAWTARPRPCWTPE